MHELALCEGVLSVALEASGGRPVKRVRVRVGQLQRVLPESWEMCWRMAAMDSPAASAISELVEAPARVRCRSCGAEGPPSPPLECAECGSPAIAILAGEELVVEEVELEDGLVLANPGLLSEVV